ncbi:DUF2442 domain-containing protein [Caldisalinibacter kiritimatiensis]|uniref:DUF2442 domain-containing protein n=1 Tax=Caldisalinibacter kiritimatiensis TaxID=1304284 RepID=R1AXI8_9FIRM|nr:DUF2442 domain-containing protein [Caldisalinibacter kiritimatiensis]EOD01908.1 hypothetical protein L21TH_0014 [Caldisalinibacter kiritimatiensis]
MIPRIRDIKTKDDYTLIVFFENDKVKEYNVKKLIKQNKNFEILKDKIIFNMVKVDPGGYGISWNDNIDLSEYELWINGKEIE